MENVAENGERKKDKPIPKSLASFPLAVRQAPASPGNQASGIDWIVQDMPEGKRMTQRWATRLLRGVRQSFYSNTHREAIVLNFVWSVALENIQRID